MYIQKAFKACCLVCFNPYITMLVFPVDISGLHFDVLHEDSCSSHVISQFSLWNVTFALSWKSLNGFAKSIFTAIEFVSTRPCNQITMAIHIHDRLAWIPFVALMQSFYNLYCSGPISIFFSYYLIVTFIPFSSLLFHSFHLVHWESQPVSYSYLSMMFFWKEWRMHLILSCS